MNSRVKELFALLGNTHAHHVVSTPESLQCTSLDLNLGERNVMPRFSREIALNIAREAKNGDLKSMLTLSMMYGVGLGLPKDEMLSICWASMSVLEAPPIELKELRKRLAEHANAITTDFVYPQYIADAHAAMKESTIKCTPETLPKITGRYRVFPRFKGLPINLVYRFSGEDCYLYDVFVENHKNILLDKVHRLDIPKVFGSIRNANTIPDYHSRAVRLAGDDTLNLIVVSGTIVVPNDLKSYVRKSHPDCKNIAELFAKFLIDDRERKPFIDRSDMEELVAQLKATQDNIAAIVDGTMSTRISREYTKAKAVYQSAKSPELYEAAMAVKEKNKAYLSGELLKQYEADVETLGADILGLELQVKEARKQHKYGYLENTFKFIANNAYYFNKKKKRKILPLNECFVDHMTSAGFDATRMIESHAFFNVKASTLDVAKLADKLSSENLNLHSLVLQPIDTVNNKSITITLS